MTLNYLHDLDGNVIAEYTSAGVLQREYIYISLDERPLVVATDTGTATPKIY